MEENKRSFVYNVEILVEDDSHQEALIQILKQLNTLNVLDYTITSGIQLGQELQIRKQKATTQQTVPVSSNNTKTTANKKESKKVTHTPMPTGLEQLITFKNDNKLVRLTVNRGLGIKLSIPCRILNIDENEQIISVYHVDEKQVYTFRLIEIEDIVAV